MGVSVEKSIDFSNWCICITAGIWGLGPYYKIHDWGLVTF